MAAVSGTATAALCCVRRRLPARGAGGASAMLLPPLEMGCAPRARVCARTRINFEDVVIRNRSDALLHYAGVAERSGVLPNLAQATLALSTGHDEAHVTGHVTGP